MAVPYLQTIPADSFSPPLSVAALYRLSVENVFILLGFQLAVVAGNVIIAKWTEYSQTANGKNSIAVTALLLSSLVFAASDRIEYLREQLFNEQNKYLADVYTLTAPTVLCTLFLARYYYNWNREGSTDGERHSKLRNADDEEEDSEL